MGRLVGWAATVLTHAALWLYPPSFRREMGGQIVEDVRRQAGGFEGVLAPITMAAWMIRLSASLALNAIGAWRELAAASPRKSTLGKSGAVSWLDVKLGLRMLVKYPGLSAVSVIGMSVAIAIGAGGFGFIHAVMDSELPLVEGERVVALQNADARNAGSRDGRALHDFHAWREEFRSVVDLSAFMTEEVSVEGPGGTSVAPVAIMTASGFRAARVSPVRGRPLLDEDEREGAPRVAVIGYDEWRRRFEADPDILGGTLRLNGTTHTIVGVMPEGFRFPVSHGYWVPFRLDPASYEVGGGPAITVFGRLAEGATVEQAQAELTAISDRLRLAYPDAHGHLRAQVLPYTRAFIGVNSPARAALVRSAQLALSLLLIVVAANVSVLMYARTTARTGEIAVRTALGASRRRVVSQLFIEAMVLSTSAALIGWAMAAFGLGWFQELIRREDPAGVPFWMHLGPSPALVAYAAGMAVVGAVIVGVLPGLKATGRAIGSRLQSFPTGRSGLRLGSTWTALIVIQVTITVAALPYALYALAPSIARGFAVPDYPVAELLQASVTPDLGGDAAGEQPAGATAALFLDGVAALLARLESEPAVSGVAFARRFPGTEQVAWVEIEGSQRAPVWINQVGTNLFTVFDVPILAGRGFLDADASQGATAVIVDRAFVEEVFDGGDVLGRRVRLPVEGGAAATSEREEGPWLEIVGVVPDFTVPPVFQPSAPKLYRPMGLAEARERVWLAVRVRDDIAPEAFLSSLREITEAVAPGLRLGQLATATSAERERTTGLLLMAVLIVAVMGSVLLLSTAGVYAMMSFIVTSRRREIGIRAALGAAPRNMLAGTFRRAGVQLLSGVVSGLVVAEATARIGGESLLFAQERAYVLPAIALVLISIGLVATLGPALRGLRVHPSEALRGE